MMRERGFSLIEILISIFVLAVGVVGAISMQLAALRTAQQSAFQTKAVHLATGMADRMRGNAGQMRSADDANPYLQVDYQSEAGASRHVTGQGCYGSASDCDAGQLARFDVDELFNQIDENLPAGRVRICRDSAPWGAEISGYRWECAATSGAPLVIKLGWRDKQADKADVAPHVVMAVAP